MSSLPVKRNREFGENDDASNRYQQKPRLLSTIASVTRSEPGNDVAANESLDIVIKPTIHAAHQVPEVQQRNKRILGNLMVLY